MKAVEVTSHIKKIVVSNRLIICLGIILYYLAYIILSIAIPLTKFRDTFHIRIANPVDALNVLRWSLPFGERFYFFMNQSLLSFYGITYGLVDWEFLFTLKEFFIQLPLALLMGIYLGFAKEYYSYRRVHCTRRAFVKRGGVYTGPAGVVVTSVLNAAVWVGTCGGICGGSAGLAVIVLFGLSLWIARIFYIVGVVGILSAIFYFAWRLLKIKKIMV